MMTTGLAHCVIMSRNTVDPGTRQPYRPAAHRRRWSVAVLCGLVALIAVPAAPAVADDHRPETYAIVRDDDLAEASGIVADPESGAVFTVQDAGTDDTNVYAIGPSGETVLTVQVPGVENEDWEDLALGTDDAGQPALFIGDIGDAYFSRRDQALGPRTEYSVIRIAKPVVDLDAGPAEIDAEDVQRWRFDYADGESHNAESLLVQPGTNRIFVVDKVERASTDAFLWAAPERLDAEGLNTFELVGAVPVTRASGAAFSADGSRLVIRDEDSAHLWHVVDEDVAAALESERTEIPLPPQVQGEGVDFLPDGVALVVNSEGRNQPIFRVPMPEDFRAGPTTVSNAEGQGGRAGSPAADLAGSRDLSVALVLGAVVWMVAVGGGYLAWRRSKGQQA
jgi:hypothetical protein